MPATSSAKTRFALLRGHDGWGKQFYELVGADAGRPFSVFCWRERLFDAFDGMARKSRFYLA